MIIKEILNRRSVREYEPTPVSQEHIIEIIKAGQFAPTARNNRAVEFIIVKEAETKDKIFEIVGQEFVKEAPVLIIPATDTTKTNCPIEDLSVASENIFLQATNLGLGSVWKAIKTEDFDGEEKIKNILRLPKQYKVINIIPIGQPKGEYNSHADEDFNPEKVHQEKW